MQQKEFILNLLQKNKEAVIVGSLGTISYDLDQIEHSNKICIRGAMGCAMAVGLGYALNTDKKVIVLIGDGAFLMKTGTISTIMKYRLPNLEVYILDNGKHKSTGGQGTNFKHIQPYIPEYFNIIHVDEEINTELQGHIVQQSDTFTIGTTIKEIPAEVRL